MTIDERFERIEHIIAGWAEERRKDREEYRELRRDTERQMSAAWLAIDKTNRAIEETNKVVAETEIQLRRAITDLASETNRSRKESDERMSKLDERIGRLVSAIGRLLPPNSSSSPAL